MQQIELPWVAPATVPLVPTVGGMAERFDVALDSQVDVALSGQAPVFAGVSGGKDSQALAYRLQAHLDANGHIGPRALIHSDLAADRVGPSSRSDATSPSQRLLWNGNVDRISSSTSSR